MQLLEPAGAVPMADLDNLATSECLVRQLDLVCAVFNATFRLWDALRWNYYLMAVTLRASFRKLCYPTKHEYWRVAVLYGQALLQNDVTHRV